MDITNTGVETISSESVSAGVATAVRAAAFGSLPTTAAPAQLAAVPACPRLVADATPQLRPIHLGDLPAQESDVRGSTWRSDDRGFGYGVQTGSSQQKHNSMKFQIRLGPPCSPPV